MKAPLKNLMNDVTVIVSAYKVNWRFICIQVMFNDM